MIDASEIIATGGGFSAATLLAKILFDRFVSKADKDQETKERQRDAMLSAVAKDVGEVKSDVRLLTQEKSQHATDIQTLTVLGADLQRRVTILETNAPKRGRR